MRSLAPSEELELDREHIIQGAWNTRTLHIDGQEITIELVKGRLHRDGWYSPGGFVAVREFAWGASATRQELQVLAYSCCEFAVPAMWTRHITSRFALEQFFTQHMQKLLPADFVLRYTNREIRATMRRMKRGLGVPYWWGRKR